MENRRLVTMGGGTGTFSVISALKELSDNITSIVAVSDSGGSTGRIRDEFGFQPVGDLRQSLAAMADPDGQEWIRKLLLYRFDKGKGLKGHNLGNLILTALQDMTGSTAQSLNIASKIFDLSGQVVPVTSQKVDLVIEYEDGSKVVGEHFLDEDQKAVKKIKQIRLTPQSSISPEAKQAISDAEEIIIGPGDLYASIMATLVVQNIKAAFKSSPARVIYLPNLMTRKTQTHGMTAHDHVEVIENAIGKKVDLIILNSQEIPEHILESYSAMDEFPVADDFLDDSRVIRHPLISTTETKKHSTDTAYRSLLRHDSDKLQKLFAEILRRE